ncbi:MAG: hypothetical protein EXR86_05370 [Gammaproteobacteria bacterium]|nr:hypothetical protein [Gammaproteobacteria bacterium]
MNVVLLRSLSLSLAVLLLCACGHFLTPKEQRREKALVLATDSYRKNMRWGNFEEAAGYLRAKEGEISGPNMESFSHYKITGYYTNEQQRNDAGDEVRVVAHIEYYELDTGVARTLRDDQYWWYDEASQRWYLGSRMPELDKH